MDWKIIDLVNIVIWPVVVAGLLLVFRKPLGAFLASFSGRITKLSAFDFSIELAELRPEPVPWSDRTIPQSSEMVGGEVYSTALVELFKQIGTDRSWDYLIVDVKDGRFWFVSRLFIFTVFLQEMRGLRCVVFVQTSCERRRLLGVASPNALRSALGQSFPWLEKALRNSLERHCPKFLAPALPPKIAGEMIRTVIEDRDMRLKCNPVEIIKASNISQIPETERPTDPIIPNEWVRLGDLNIWEHTHWLDLSLRSVSDTVRKCFDEWDSSHYEDMPGLSNEERIRQVLCRESRYIALVNSRGEFKALLDRQKLAALVGDAMADEVKQDKASSKHGNRQ
jgi:hypothetical protein